VKKILTFLIVFTILIIFLEFYFYCLIPDTLLMPLVGTNAIIVTLILAYISYSQWQKNRLENEVLKEQLKLIIDYLSYMQKSPNQSTLISAKHEKILLSEFIPFSIVNYNSISKLDHNKYITHQFATKELDSQWFNELKNDIIYNPFFPKELFNIIKKLDILEYFISKNYCGNWYNDKEVILPEQQLVLMQGLEKDKLNIKMLRLPYDNNYLKISDIIAIYKEFHQELNKWFYKNNINIDLNINYN